MRIVGDDLSRLLSRTKKQEDGCWVWQGARLTNGYGSVRVLRDGVSKAALAHRLAYELVSGPIPAGMQLDHLCRVRHCINPTHLEPVTQVTNILRGESPWARRKRQTHCIHGHPLAGANVRVRRDGTRQCRECDREQQRRKAQRRKDRQCSSV